MPNNLWEIIKFDDLIYLLRNAEKRFVVLGIITENTEEHIKKIIKIFMKEKSKIYPKVTFLFYKAKNKDFGRLQPMFDKDITKYPKIFHIWDVKEIMSGVIAVDNGEIMEKSFEDFHDVYLAGSISTQNRETDEIQNTEESDDKSKDIEKKLDKKEECENNDKNNKNNNLEQKKVYIPQQQSAPTIQPINQTYKDPIIEKKKFMEKLHLLRKKQEDCTLDFLNEFKKRKKEEEGEEKEEKDSESNKKKKKEKKK
jgi:hypothetical protein